MTKPQVRGRNWRAAIEEHEITRRNLRRKLKRVAANDLTQAHRLQLLVQAAILCDELGDHIQEMDKIATRGFA